MQARRLKDGNKTIFDYRDLLGDGRKHKGKTLLRYEGNAASYETESGIRFFKDHPFQWVPTEDADFLVSNEIPYAKFTKTTIDRVEDYYSF